MCFDQISICTRPFNLDPVKLPSPSEVRLVQAEVTTRDSHTELRATSHLEKPQVWPVITPCLQSALAGLDVGLQMGTSSECTSSKLQKLVQKPTDVNTLILAQKMDIVGRLHGRKCSL